MSKFIAEASLIGDGRKFVSALIVPEYTRLEKFARSRQITFATRAELIASPQVKELYEAEIDRTCSLLASFEKVKKFALLVEDFTIESGEMTPSMKVKRRIVEEKYKKLIDSLYED